MFWFVGAILAPFDRWFYEMNNILQPGQALMGRNPCPYRF